MGSTLYIADNLNDRVMKWEIGATSGTLVAGSGEVADNDELSKLSSPEGVAVNKEGTLFVTNIGEGKGNSRVTRWRKRSQRRRDCYSC